jgi:hypothetical protein
MGDERTSHLLCKDRHAAFGLKKVQILHRDVLEIKASQKRA